MRRFFTIALTLAAIAFACFLAFAITLRLALHGREYSVPDFANHTVAEGTDLALADGFSLTIDRKVYSTTVPAGRIVSQSPVPGTRVRHGWIVRVIESLGPQQVNIPDVTGHPLREAALNLRRQSLDVGTLAHIPAPGAPDMVLAQTPPPGAGLDQPKVDLLLSAPDPTQPTSTAAVPASQPFVLPSFTGLTYAAANREAYRLGLKIAVSGEANADGTVSGLVTAQQPESGHRAAPGDTLKLTLNR